MEDILAIVFLFGGGTFAALAYSPIGRAWADRMLRPLQDHRELARRLRRDEIREAIRR